jgi:hypothetical protein
MFRPHHLPARGPLAVGVALMLAVWLVPGTALAASGTTRWVNDDKPVAAAPGKGCDKPGYSDIQSAINASNPGDTIKVCAGTYAGATVDRAVILDGDHAIINTGPYSHPSVLRAGFLFNPDRSGSGTTIKGFTFVGAVDPHFADPNNLDFGVFSRGADNVTVKQNEFDTNLQAITSHNGTGWSINHNKIRDLWVTCGGGIGIVVGGNDGTTSVVNNEIGHNDIDGTVFVGADDCGGYTATGITLYADFRYGRPGAPEISDNSINHNNITLVSSMPAIVEVNGIELTDTRADDNFPAVPGNVINHNSIGGQTGVGIWSSAGTSGNSFNHNQINGALDFSCQDESAGAGTSGTANLWDKNNGKIASDPAGLCD